jgi:hypothetical protein
MVKIIGGYLISTLLLSLIEIGINDMDLPTPCVLEFHDGYFLNQGKDDTLFCFDSLESRYMSIQFNHLIHNQNPSRMHTQEITEKEIAEAIDGLILGRSLKRNDTIYIDIAINRQEDTVYFDIGNTLIELISLEEVSRTILGIDLKEFTHNEVSVGRVVCHEFIHVLYPLEECETKVDSRGDSLMVSFYKKLF